MRLSETGLLFDYYHRRNNALRKAVYEYKKCFLRQQTADWPDAPPPDIESLPESVQWWWRTLASLRQESLRARRGFEVKK